MTKDFLPHIHLILFFEMVYLLLDFNSQGMHTNVYKGILLLGGIFMAYRQGYKGYNGHFEGRGRGGEGRHHAEHHHTGRIVFTKTCLDTIEKGLVPKPFDVEKC